MNMKKFIASTISASLVASVAVPVTHAKSTNGFADVKEGATFYHEIMTLANQNIIKGFTNGEFQPNQQLTRGQVALLFSRALKLETPSNVSELVSHFNDIPKNSEVTNAIAALVKEGIITEKEDAFRPGSPLTRDVMATWLVRAFGLKPDVSITVNLNDLDTIDRTHVDHVITLFQNGITTGQADGSYAPTRAVTRGQFAAFMYRSIYQIKSVTNPADAVYDISEKVELPDKVAVTYTNGTQGEAVITWNTSEIDLAKPGTYRIVGNITGSTKKAFANVKIEDQPLAVESINVANLKQIEVQFNHARFNSADIKNTRYYTLLSSTGDKLTISDVEIVDNKVILTIETLLDKADTALLQINRELFGTQVVEQIEILDSTKPSIETVEAISNDQIRVVFSEPMDFKTENNSQVTNHSVLSSIGLVGYPPSIQSVTVLKHGKEVVIEFVSALAEGNQKLTISEGLKDYAGLSIEAGTFDFKMDIVASRPALAEVINIYPNQYTLVFNKEITLVNHSNPGSYFFFNTLANSASHVVQTGEKELTVVYSDKVRIPENSTIFVKPGIVKDAWGNPNYQIRQDIKVVNDYRAPLINKVEVVDSAATNSTQIQIKVYFNEPTTNSSAMNLQNYLLLDESGKRLQVKRVDKDFSSKVNSSYILTLESQYSSLKSGSYTLVANNVADQFDNKSTASFTFFAKNNQPPGDFTANVLISNQAVRFIINYNEAMATAGGNSVLDLAKYEVQAGGHTTLLSTLAKDSNVDVRLGHYDKGSVVEIVMTPRPTLSGNNKTLINALKSAVTSKNFYQVDLVVGMVEDADGNRTNSISNKLTLKSEPTFTIAEDGVEAEDVKTIKLTFKEKVDKLNKMTLSFSLIRTETVYTIKMSLLQLKKR